VISLRRFMTSTESRPYQIGPEAAAALARWLKRASGITAAAAFLSVTKS
jgi:hypothetical protein